MRGHYLRYFPRLTVHVLEKLLLEGGEACLLTFTAEDIADTAIWNKWLEFSDRQWSVLFALCFYTTAYFIRRMRNDQAILGGQLFGSEGGQPGSPRGAIPLDEVSFVRHRQRSSFVSYPGCMICMECSLGVFNFRSELDLSVISNISYVLFLDFHRTGS